MIKKHYKKVVFFLFNVVIVATGALLIKNSGQKSSTNSLPVSMQGNNQMSPGQTGAITKNQSKSVTTTSVRTRTS